ncbi:hypothetical protein [Streptacidiphilus rugosus]|nr:hypothetical protein [Streptacidiphilus rugosus]
MTNTLARVTEESEHRPDQVLLVSGPFASIDQFTAAASGGTLQLLLVGVR